MFNCYLFSDVFCGTLHCQNGLDKPIVDGGVTHINMQVQLLLSFEVAYLWKFKLDDQGVIQEKHVECKIMTGGMDMMAGQVIFDNHNNHKKECCSTCDEDDGGDDDEDAMLVLRLMAGTLG